MLTLGHPLPTSNQLTKQEKVIITKIYNNLNTICKLSVREVK